MVLKARTSGGGGACNRCKYLFFAFIFHDRVCNVHIVTMNLWGSLRAE